MSALIIRTLAGVAWYYRRRMRYLRSTGYLARQQLQSVKDDFSRHGDELRLVRELSALLRQICVTVYPRTEAASLIGKDWLALLDRPVCGEPFSKGAGRILIEAPYQQQPVIDVDALLPLCREWIGAVTGDNRQAKR